MESGGRTLADAARADGVRASMGGGTHRDKMPALDAGQTLEVKKGLKQQRAMDWQDFVQMSMEARN
jgi:hypothetical protein